MSRTDAFSCLPQIVTLRGYEERMGDQRDKGSSLMQALQQLCLVKGTSPDEATLISKEIKSLTQAVPKLCLSKGISKSVRRKMR